MKSRPLSEVSQRAIQALRSPGRVSDLAKELNLDYDAARRTLRCLREAGFLEALGNGLYQTNAAGIGRLNVRKAGSRVIGGLKFQEPPPGKTMTAERLAWLERNYPAWGPRRCSEALGITYQYARHLAKKRGLVYGCLDGYLLLTEVVRLLDGDHDMYCYLWSKAKRAGVLRYPPGANGTQKTSRKQAPPSVPIEWLEQISHEHTPPAPGDLRIGSAARRLNKGKTTVQRACSRLGLQTYLAKPRYGPPARYIRKADVVRLEAHFAAQTPHKNTGGQAQILNLLYQAGHHGMTQKDLQAAMGCTSAAVRFGLSKLTRNGLLSTVEPLNQQYPRIYRLVEYAATIPTSLSPQYARRYLNHGRVLAEIRQQGATSREDLVRRTEASTATISKYLQDLIRWGLVRSKRMEANRKLYATHLCLPA